MSTPSSTESWSGTEVSKCHGTNDIIDLDKFMRGAVRPSRSAQNERNLRNSLVVDAGGVERKILNLGKLCNTGTTPRKAHAQVRSPPSTPGTTALTSGSSKSASTRPPYTKRFSHDSGLSDGSYRKQKHHTPRHMGAGDIKSRSNNGAVPGIRNAASGTSMRTFRAVCQRTLLDQQAQIARVAQLCEKLTEHHVTSVEAGRSSRGARPAPRRKSESSSMHTSEATSSSLSSRTRETRVKDKHKVDECKTYKIIMKKLDELNIMFASRDRTRAIPAQLYELSSDSVSVSDKLVATDPTFLKVHGADITPGAIYDPCTGSANEPQHLPSGMTSTPKGKQHEHKENSGGSGERKPKSLGLDEPTKVSVEAVEAGQEEKMYEKDRSSLGDRREPSLCALCRGYLRAFKQFVLQIRCNLEPNG